MYNPHLCRSLRTICCTLFLSALLLLGPAYECAVAQMPSYEVHPDYLAKHFSTADGLPVNGITGVLQARDGYLWMTTFDGLVRFDGQRFTIFTTANNPGLPGNRLHALQEDHTGRLWMLTEGGSLIRYHDERFTVFGQAQDVPENIFKLQLEGDTLWLSTPQGVAFFYQDQGHLFHPEEISGNVRAVLRDRHGNRWISTYRDGLYRVRPDGTVKRFTEEDGLLDAYNVSVLFEDREGVIWAALAPHNYGEAGTSRLYALRGDRFELFSYGGRPWTRHVTAMHQTDEGTLWLGANESTDSGIGAWWTYDDGRLIPFPAVEPSHGLFPDAALVQRGADGALWRVLGRWLYRDETPVLRVEGGYRAFTFDGQGNVWVATAAEGLFRLRRSALRTFSRPEGLPVRNLYPILEDRRGRIWIGTWDPANKGVIRLEDEAVTGVFPIGSCCVPALYEDRAGTIWAGTLGGGLHRLPKMHGEAELELGAIRAMLEDRRGRFWVGAENGLALGRATDEGYTWTRFTTETGLSNNWVRVIVETAAGDLLLGTNGGGLMRYSEEGTFEAFTTDDGLASDLVRDIYEDAEGLLWIATEDRGLCRLDRQGRTALRGASTVCLSKEEGLFDNSLHRILEDDYGRLWFNTNNGIFWIKHAGLNAFAAGTVASVTSVGYTERDGMRNREGNGGMQPAGIKASDGRLWFPTQDGAVVIDPSAIGALEIPRVVIETTQYGGADHRVEAALVLAPKERDVGITYTALEFTRPNDVRFRYKLDGYDETWKEAGDSRQATYTNLSPGRYTFRIKAGLGGAWSEEDATLSIIRQPFFWETTWFYGLVALLFIMAGPSIYAYRVRRLKARQEALEQTVKERTAQIRANEAQLEQQADELRRANELKSRFLANISHEFRTPLTLTFGPLDDLLAGRFHVDDEARPHLECARRNGQRLLRLINQLLDLARLDAHTLPLQAQFYDLAHFLRQRVAIFESLAASRHLRLRFEPAAAPLRHAFDAEKLETVVLNLLSNAFKFTPEGGAITVSLHKDVAGAAVLTVRDTGQGIAAEHLPHVFDRFFQSDGSSTRARGGTGIGLALVKQFIDLHGGQIAVESAVGAGTTFTITLPPITIEEPSTNGSAGASDGRSSEAVLADLAATQPIRSNEVEAAIADEEATLVLIVEDNPDMRHYLRAHLEDCYHIEEATNGAEGVAKAVELVPDLVLSDVMMPEMDGLDLLAALKADPRTSHVPVVLLTARADAESKIEGLETGADDYLPKPFNAEELRARVHNLIEGRRRLRTLFSQEANESEKPTLELPSMDAAFLARVQEVVEEHLGDAGFGVDALAEAVGMSRRQLLRKLRALVDEKPNAMIRRVRLERAAAMLRQKSGNVKEVAYAVGFTNLSYFGKVFRETYGVVPSEY